MPSGRFQREFKATTETSSLTVSIEAMIMSCTLHVKYEQYDALIVIPGASLHSSMDG